MSDREMQDEPSLLSRLGRFYVSSMQLAAGCLMALIVTVMVAQVVARYGFDSSLIWAEELCRYLLIWMTFLLLGMAYRTGALISFDLVPLMLSTRSQRVLRLLTSIPVLCFLVLMTWYGWDYASRFVHQTIPALDFISDYLFGRPAGLSIRLVYVSVSVGSGLLALHVLADTVHTLLALIRNAPEEPHPPVPIGEQ